MRGFLSSLIIAAVLLFAPITCKSQQAYTNNQQNFSMSVPGSVDVSDSTDTIFTLTSYSAESNLGVMVVSPNIKVPKTRESVDAVDLSAFGAYSCQDTTYNGDFAKVCPLATTNDAGVKIIGKVWACVHGSYVYIVGIVVSADSQSTSQVDYYLNSFVFLR